MICKCKVAKSSGRIEQKIVTYGPGACQETLRCLSWWAPSSGAAHCNGWPWNLGDGKSNMVENKAQN